MFTRHRIVLCVALFLAPVSLHAEEARGLEIYFIDTEGGAATLLVTPQRESVLIDCGNPGGRDAERIHRVATRAGLKAIDHLIITHWHSDHYGGVGRLSKLLPIHHYYDRGIPDTLAEDPKNFPLLIAAYRAGHGWQVADAQGGRRDRTETDRGRIAFALALPVRRRRGAARQSRRTLNPLAKDVEAKPEDTSDNAKSLGFLLSFGGFRFLDLGDLTWNVEHKLVAPSDKIGKVDVYQVTHHGLDISNNPALLKTVSPRVAVFNNGARKGCHPSVTTTLRRLPEIQAIYQMHRNVTVGSAENTDPAFIANADEKCQGESIHLTVAADGRSYTVTVGNSGKARRYETRAMK